MKDNKEEPKAVNTCFEGWPCAEMMQEIMGEQGIGSLCDEVMRSVIKRRREGKEAPQEINKQEV